MCYRYCITLFALGDILFNICKYVYMKIYIFKVHINLCLLITNHAGIKKGAKERLFNLIAEKVNSIEEKLIFYRNDS